MILYEFDFRCAFAQGVERLVERYNQEMLCVTTRREALLAISRLVRETEILHPFPDGNGRTLIAVLMNHLLLYNGFLPAMLWDPNLDLELSAAEFADEIERGIQQTEILMADPDATVYEYSIQEARPEDIQAFEVLAKDLLIRLAPYTCPPGAVSMSSEPAHDHIFIYLTPRRLAEITKGHWLNANHRTLEALRFQSVSVDADGPPNRLLFCRDIDSLLKIRPNPAEALIHLAQAGVDGIVVNDIALARCAPMPALVVNDVDDALYAAARATRRAVNCKTIAVVGTVGKTTAQTLLYALLTPQATVHAQWDARNTTPQIMTSLASLRLTDQLELLEIALRNRPTVTRHRMGAAAPDICLITAFDLPDTADEQTITGWIDGYAAIADGLRDGGLCLINSQSRSVDLLTKALQARKPVAVQTFGDRSTDLVRLRSAAFDATRCTWQINANIIGTEVDYEIAGEGAYLPTLSVGVRAVCANLGYAVAI